MTEIDKTVDASWGEFLKSLGDADEKILTQIHCPVEEFFDEQKHIDRARKELFKPEFNKVLRLYLGRVDLRELSGKIKAYQKNFERGFGRDRLNHLKLLVPLLMIMNEKKPKKGLLAS